MAKVLVTGGAGFVGSHVAERLLADGHAVTALDDLSTGAWSNLDGAGGELTRVEADVRDLPRLTALMHDARFDAVVHLAAWASVVASIERPVAAYTINVGGTLNVLEAARTTGTRRVVFASSTAVYGRAPHIPTHEGSALQPVSPYAAHKAAGEFLCAAYRAAYGLETLALRYFNVYGRRQTPNSPYAGVVAIFARRLSAGETITVHGDGAQTRDFIHVSDVAAVTARAATGPDPGGEPINVGSGSQTTLLTLLSTLQAELGVQAPIVFGPERVGDVRYSQADITRLRERLGYVPQVELRQGLADLLDCTGQFGR